MVLTTNALRGRGVWSVAGIGIGVENRVGYGASIGFDSGADTRGSQGRSKATADGIVGLNIHFKQSLAPVGTRTYAAEGPKSKPGRTRRESKQHPQGLSPLLTHPCNAPGPYPASYCPLPLPKPSQSPSTPYSPFDSHLRQRKATPVGHHLLRPGCR
eukprot:1102028-Amorphochlora_amoeboformis.AAC.1